MSDINTSNVNEPLFLQVLFALSILNVCFVSKYTYDFMKT